jgi:DMSO/TMAO reductase YedYZ molybdopterin-dependent catalytic subunit
MAIEAPETGVEPTSRRAPRAEGALVGVAAALFALGLAELIAGFSPGLRSPVLDIGDRAIDLVPSGIKEFAIDVFGTADKPVLLIGIVGTLLAYSALVGVIAVRRSPTAAVLAIAGIGVVGAVAAGSSPIGPYGALPSLVGVAGGIAALLILVGRQRMTTIDHHFGASRRSFLVAAGAVIASAGALGGLGRALDTRFDAARIRAGVRLPPPETPLAAIPRGVAFEDISGITPFTTPTADFYRIDTALTVPQVAVDSYRLSITGMVDRELQLSYADLLDRELVESDITLTCVSNEVGGRLAGNARWLGVRLDDLLSEAVIQPGADQIVGRSVDRYTCGFPVAALDGRDAMIALGMNGAPLPLEHGFPARLIVPGLYGYVSATKWLAEIRLTTFSDFDHYWVGRGWSAQAPIKTQSRIDTPGPLQKIPAGPTVIAGVAWAQTRGIDRVEVGIDGGDWQAAELATELSNTTWRQWRLPWQATPGRHDIECRATDRTGETQTETRAEPMPDGATGWHSIVVLVDR